MEAAKIISTQGSKEKVGKAFSWFHALSINGTPMLMGAIIASYFSAYMTDVIMIPAAAASAIMFIATLWDAINDPIMGIIADRTNTKWGRYRPYFIAAPILLTVFATLIWVNPDFSVTGKVAWVAVTYIGYGMTSTLYTMPQMAVLPACVKSTERRNSIIALGAGCTAVAFTIGSSFATDIKGFFENNLHFSNGYLPIMIICSLLSFIPFWGLFATAKEKYLTKVEKGSVIRDLNAILRHKELSPFIIVWIMASLGYGLMFSSSVYYVIYYLERPDLITQYMLVVSLGALVSMTVLMPVVLKIFQTGQKSLFVTQIAAMICYIILFIFGKSSMVLLYAVTFTATSIASMSNALVNVLVNDAIDYVQLKDGISANGVIASIKGFAQKCGNTVTNSGILAFLALASYVPNAIGEQPASAMFAINFLRFGAPCITGIIMLFCLRFNPVEKHYAEIEEMKSKMNSDQE